MTVVDASTISIDESKKRMSPDAVQAAGDVLYDHFAEAVPFNKRSITAAELNKIDTPFFFDYDGQCICPENATVEQGMTHAEFRDAFPAIIKVVAQDEAGKVQTGIALQKALFAACEKDGVEIPSTGEARGA